MTKNLEPRHITVEDGKRIVVSVGDWNLRVSLTKEERKI